VRRALLIGESADPEGPDTLGMIVLGPRWRPESMSPGVEEWFRNLPDGNLAASRLPKAVLAMARRAARSATSRDDRRKSRLLGVLTRSGRWVVLHGLPLAAIEAQRVAVIAEPAHPGRIPHAYVGLRPDGTRAGVDQTSCRGSQPSISLTSWRSP
jgi:hypothetical protein